MTDTTQNTVQLVIERYFEAPRHLVYQAFTDPDQLAAWFGPHGFSVPRESIDMEVRVGGHQRFTMVHDDTPSYTSGVNATFTEVIENELLVGTERVTSETFHGEDKPDWAPDWEELDGMTLRLEFHDEGTGTRLVVRQGPFSAQVEGDAREGWGQSFGKLDLLLSQLA